ncbi:polyphenol oxidase family protein [Arthrobacter sp. NamB2]|uniref:polyphenol oxidase family protein n=1 Tax=Arthrobacter sp. NamB2 TaxID=2576035 RepID=UPI001CB9181A|nr:polyphenol oxidase family protein [Arthrobacter sp. NamB2]
MRSSIGPERTSPFYWNEEVRPGLRVAFTSIEAGNLALHVGDDSAGVRNNRRLLEAAMGIAPGSLRFMSQTHSNRVATLGDGAADAPDADGLVSRSGCEPLAVLVADCVPIVLADASVDDGGTGATAVVHAGRAGVGNGVIAQAIHVLRAGGARDLSGWIGPSVCGSCYEVPEAMMLEMAQGIPAAASRTTTGTAALDLPAAARCQLEEGGVKVGEVRGADALCTVENSALYSHRRAPGAGRTAGLVWRT